MKPFLPVSRVREFVPRNGRRKPADAVSFTGLHWLAAGLFLATGAGAAAGPRLRKQGTALGAVLAGARRTPLLLAPLAGAAHGVHALRPGLRTRRVANALSWLALGAAAVDLGVDATRTLTRNGRPGRWRGGRRAAWRAAWHAWLGLAPPLAFGATGLLGLLLEREERGEAVRHRRLERRAQVVERLVPKRRARVDCIVVHV